MMGEELKLEVTLASNGYIVNVWGNICGQAFIRKCIATNINQAATLLIDMEAEFRLLGVRHD